MQLILHKYIRFTFFMCLAGLKVRGSCGLKIVNENGTRVVAVDKMSLDLSIEYIKIQLLNLFGGNPILGN